MTALPMSLPRPQRWKAPGTCGELLQGTLDDQDFMVNCPIDLYSRARVAPVDEPGVHVTDEREFSKILSTVDLVADRLGAGASSSLDRSDRSAGIRADSDRSWLAKIAVRRSGAQRAPLAGRGIGRQVVIDSDVPRGKGMASSTADVCAAMAAVCRSCDLRLSDTELARLVTQVEPSDCTHFSGIAHLNFLNGELRDLLPPPEGLRVLVVDCGGEVDTLSFDRERAHRVYKANTIRLRRALHRLKRGLRSGCFESIAAAATFSAELSQQILYKPQFEPLLAQARELGALGVNCAHSGTVLGVMYDPRRACGSALRASVQRNFGDDLAIVGDFAIIGGGCVEY